MAVFCRVFSGLLFLAFRLVLSFCAGGGSIGGGEPRSHQRARATHQKHVTVEAAPGCRRRDQGASRPSPRPGGSSRKRTRSISSSCDDGGEKRNATAAEGEGGGAAAALLVMEDRRAASEQGAHAWCARRSGPRRLASRCRPVLIEKRRGSTRPPERRWRGAASGSPRVVGRRCVARRQRRRRRHKLCLANRPSFFNSSSPGHRTHPGLSASSSPSGARARRRGATDFCARTNRLLLLLSTQHPQNNMERLAHLQSELASVVQENAGVLSAVAQALQVRA